MKSLILSFFLLFILALSTGGCAPKGPTGSWEANREARHLFQSGSPLENHTYYFTGSSVRPNAVIALDNSYTLSSRLWVEVAVTPTMLSSWLNEFKTDYSFRCPYQGGYIRTPAGQVAGIWYSKRELNTVREPEPGILEIFLPRFIPLSECERQQRIDDF